MASARGKLSRILLVDDDRDVREVTRLALERGGFAVLAHASGAQALADAEEFRPQLLLLDVAMREMDGPTTLALLRSLQGLEQTPAVFLTAKASAREAGPLARLGVAGVIAKPFDPMRLAEEVERIWHAASPEPPPMPAGGDFGRLREDYARAFPHRWRRLHEAWSRARAGDEGALETACGILHQLAGSGATFGFPEVSRIAGEARRMLDRPRRGAGGPVAAAIDRALEALRDAAAAADAPMREDEPAVRAANAPGRPGRVVYLFEEDAELAQAFQARLRAFGFDVRIFATPTLLEAALRRARPEAVVMDVVLAEGRLAGPRAVVESAAMRWSNVPVLFVSGRTDLDARLGVVRAGAAAYLAKPVRIAELVERLDRLCGDAPEAELRAVLVDPGTGRAPGIAAALGREGIACDLVADPVVLPDLFEHGNVDTVLICGKVPGCTSAELAAVIHQVERAAQVPVVLLAGDDADPASLAAADAVLAPAAAEADVVAAVRKWCVRHRQHRGLASTDGLTGLANRTRVLQQLDVEEARARRYRHPLSVAMLDVDRFKRVNDREGRAAGDRVLASLGGFLRQRLRKTDFVGRYGGEEFMVLMPETPAAGALARLERLRAEFSALQHFGPGSAFAVTFSAGVACSPPIAGPAALAAAADGALHRSKRAGRDRVTLAAEPQAVQ